MLLGEVPTMMLQSDINVRALLLQKKENEFMILLYRKVETEKMIKRMKPEIANLRKDLLEACL